MLLPEQYRPFLSEHLMRGQQNAQDDSGQSTDHQEWGSPGKSPITGKWFAFVCPWAHSLTKVHLSCRIWSEIYFIHKYLGSGEIGKAPCTLHPALTTGAHGHLPLRTWFRKYLSGLGQFATSALLLLKVTCNSKCDF